LPFKDADRLLLLGDHLGNNPGIGVTALLSICCLSPCRA
jgi:hypothetical protein